MPIARTTRFPGWTGPSRNSEAGPRYRSVCRRGSSRCGKNTRARSRHFLHGQREPAPGIFDIAWFEARMARLIPELSWKNPEHRLLCLRRATRNADGDGLDADASAQSRPARIIVFNCRSRYCRRVILIDTARPDAAERSIKDKKSTSAPTAPCSSTPAGASRCNERIAMASVVRRKSGWTGPDAISDLGSGAERSIASRSRAGAAADDARRRRLVRGRSDCGAGTRYRYMLQDGTRVPDPASRAQDGDVHGASVVVDPASYRWRNRTGAAGPGTKRSFTNCTSACSAASPALRAQLPRLAALGITAIELMPIAEFPGAPQLGL